MSSPEPRWRKSTFSGTQSACVELADAGDRVLLRNSNHPDAGTLALAPEAMAAWVAEAAAGGLDDLAGSSSEPRRAPPHPTGPH